MEGILKVKHMGNLQLIESALEKINDAVFQELIDSFLILRNPNYRAFSRIGSMKTKQKTKPGTPDTFILLPDGNYIFSEVTTNISDKKKLEEDILACFDSEKSKIPSNKISQIILSFNWKIKQEEVEELRNLAKSYNENVDVVFYSLDCLAKELNLHHNNLVYTYLGLEFDTGQIVNIEIFLEEYNKQSNSIATPLDNTFFHREKEMKELVDSIENNDIIILTGKVHDKS